ncbi:bifunctional DNA primase/polymerase [Nocardia sp. NPDC059246]|uniref:bifunctional DNA primase/polymerase n=1 Tax=unclassified Nocardia TaxID=2637762 RepID=UPI00368BB905
MHPYHFRDAALRTAHRGWHVFPLRPHSKTPAIGNWPQQATTDPVRIHQFWPRNSRRNIAVACGPSRLFVIDLDIATTRVDKSIAQPTDGRNTLGQLAIRHRKPVPAPTLTVSTPSTGYHLYYRSPPRPRLGNSIGLLKPHIDTRAHGGYVVAAGSRLPHGAYRVVDPHPADPAAAPDHRPADSTTTVDSAATR